MTPVTSPTPSREFDVIILGAGISGLSAAYTIKKKSPKLRVAILEARDRIGGRMFTAELGNGLVSEYGAEWVGKTHKNMRRLCRELGVSLEPHTFKNYAYLQKGKHTPDPTLLNALKKLEKILERWPSIRGKNFKILDHMSIRHLIAKDCTKEEMDVLDRTYADEYGQDIRYVSALRAVADHLTGGKNSHMDFHIKGGNRKLIQSLGKFIGLKNIFLKKEVVKICQNKRNVYITCHDGTIWFAKKIICTLPAQIIAKIHFEPTMSKEMRSAVKNLKYGDIVKVILLFKKRFWKAEDYSQLSSGITEYVFHTTQGQRGKMGALCIHATGKRADSLTHMSINQIWERLKNSFPYYIDTRGIKPVKMFRHSWTHDPFVRGAYAVYQPDEWSRVQKYFGQPYNHIHFSGEYLASLQGFMEGASTTGIKAAKDIIKELKKK